MTRHILANHRPCDLFNQLAKKLVTRAAALLARFPGIRRLQQNRLPPGSTRGQSGIPEVAFCCLQTATSEYVCRYQFCPACFKNARFSLELVPLLAVSVSHDMQRQSSPLQETKFLAQVSTRFW